jgi:hypothetical protein
MSKESLILLVYYRHELLDLTNSLEQSHTSKAVNKIPILKPIVSQLNPFRNFTFFL